MLGGGGRGGRARLSERENSNLKTLFYKDCSLGVVERKRERETARGLKS